MKKRRSGSLLSLRDQLQTVEQYSGRALDYKEHPLVFKLNSQEIEERIESASKNPQRIEGESSPQGNG